MIQTVSQYEENYTDYFHANTHITVSQLLNDKCVQQNSAYFLQFLRFINNMCVFHLETLQDLSSKGILDLLLSFLRQKWAQAELLDMVIETLATFAAENITSINQQMLESDLLKLVQGQM